MTGTSDEFQHVIDADHLAHQREWSLNTFGPGDRLKGVLDHIRKELKEVEDDPTDLGEWVDIIILAFDGAWRAGWEPQDIIDAIKTKQARNEARKWPDWRTMSADRAIEHDRSQELCQTVVNHPRFGPMKCLWPLPCNHSDPAYFGRKDQADDR
jgi:hypothetical protein